VIMRDRLVSEGVNTGVERRRILGSVVKIEGQTGADEDSDTIVHHVPFTM